MLYRIPSHYASTLPEWLMQLWDILQRDYACPLSSFPPVVTSCKTIGHYHNQDVDLDTMKSRIFSLFKDSLCHPLISTHISVFLTFLETRSLRSGFQHVGVLVKTLFQVSSYGREPVGSLRSLLEGAHLQGLHPHDWITSQSPYLLRCHPVGG